MRLHTHAERLTTDQRIYEAIVKWGAGASAEQVRAACALHDLREIVRRWEL
jgi:hypothetical protein